MKRPACSASHRAYRAPRRAPARVLRAALSAITALAVAWAMVLPPAPARAQNKAPALIRDAEIEDLIRDYSAPIFRAARLNASAINIYILGDKNFNAFVADGRRMFINAGALMQSKTPNEIIGVIAHESGHIEGGHLARLRQQLRGAQVTSIIAMLLGVGALAAGAASGSDSAGQAGAAIITGGQTVAQRGLLAYQRSEEAAADRAAVRYLESTSQSTRGMVETFKRFADQQLVSLRYIDPYVQSHPMPRERLSALEQISRSSRFFSRTDPPALQRRHDLMRAKLRGFLESPDTVLRTYPESDQSLPAKYARAIVSYLSADLRIAQDKIDELIRIDPSNPYFLELKGQALLESGRGQQAIEPLRKAISMVPNSGLIRSLYGQALLASENPANLDAAIAELQRSLASEPDAVVGWRQLANAYGRKGDIARAELASARAYFAAGDLGLAKHHATRVQNKTKKGSPLWLQADDIINFRPKS